MNIGMKYAILSLQSMAKSKKIFCSSHFVHQLGVSFLCIDKWSSFMAKSHPALCILFITCSAFLCYV